MRTVKSSDEYLPSLYLNDKQLPEIKTWRVGGRYRVMLELEQTGMNASNDSEAGKHTSATFRIINIKPLATNISKEAVLKVMAEKAKV